MRAAVLVRSTRSRARRSSATCRRPAATSAARRSSWGCRAKPCIGAWSASGCEPRVERDARMRASLQGKLAVLVFGAVLAGAGLAVAINRLLDQPVLAVAAVGL